MSCWFCRAVLVAGALADSLLCIFFLVPAVAYLKNGTSAKKRNPTTEFRETKSSFSWCFLWISVSQVWFRAEALWSLVIWVSQRRIWGRQILWPENGGLLLGVLQTVCVFFCDGKNHVSCHRHHLQQDLLLLKLGMNHLGFWICFHLQGHLIFFDLIKQICAIAARYEPLPS